MTFDVAAESYDRFMGRWSSPLARQFATLADVDTGGRVLDVGCGPGALTTVLVERLGADRVSAVDPSESFVEAVRQRLPGVDVQRATGADLPFPDGGFAVSFAQLVVNFMPDPVAGLTEIGRVTRPGGTVAACLWDHGTGRGPLSPFWTAVHRVDPDAVDEALLPGAHPGELAAMFAAAGLRDVDERTLTVTREFADLDAWWEPFTLGVGPAGSYLATVSPATRAAIREQCADVVPPAPFTLESVALAVTGRTVSR